jgi:hypothetical protein
MNLVKKPVTYYDMISIQVPANSTQTKFTFPDQPLLRNKKINSIEFFTSNNMDYDINGSPLVATSVFNKGCYLVLYYDGYENVHRIPLIELHTISTNTNGATVSTNINGNLMLSSLNITWTKSYVEIPSASTPVSIINQVFTFGVQYENL